MYNGGEEEVVGEVLEKVDAGVPLEAVHLAPRPLVDVHKVALRNRKERLVVEPLRVAHRLALLQLHLAP